MQGLRVLSLFDGISCGQVALERAGIAVDVYYASEIDKHAIKITQKNYPKTVQLGDVRKIDFTKFIGEIDLILGGSPCQDLSIAGKRKGLSGERSGLFYKFVEALDTIKPKYFLLENNYGMPQAAYEEISKCVGCYPVLINSALVSAQTRKRYYWTNIGDKNYNLFGFPTVAIPEPIDKKILLKDILQSGYAYKNKSACLTARYQGATFPHDYLRNQKTQVAELLKVPENTKKGYAEIRQGECVDLTHINSKTRRGRAMREKCNCLQTQSEFYQYISPASIYHHLRGGKICTTQGQRVTKVVDKTFAISDNLYKINLPDGEYIIRKLTPIECERLQTLPDNYTLGISETQRYKTIGNGWTVDVIAYIFSFLKLQE